MKITYEILRAIFIFLFISGFIMAYKIQNQFQEIRMNYIYDKYSKIKPNSLYLEYFLYIVGNVIMLTINIYLFNFIVKYLIEMV